ncbi:hypothetical protein TTHERM_00442940 (macronuclear) [Tetrahymena thermophila SB210]|uniref:Uncharacterized protein n=1 Tax=Tetrahymena thermophila (strain SB210) TaxID=312017 RepID=I7MGX0_TETTS|nr:hypothetical protein TTHERM_00442940 [Tetrahymena thermophila SB210]EAR85544.2 hypothetical protein TTHERM_00442940 [Tetrahymena thermophila SB210]|eukprot:XP_001033207.2 hypothetical protein TTHERM_00442940 [Tetrahymena thermophila SB210]
MGCCQSENRLEDLGYIKPDMIDKKMYMYSKQPQVINQNLAKIQLQNMNGGSIQSQDQVYQERVAINFRYSKKQLSEIREQDPHMESSLHYDGSQTKSAKSNRINDQFSEGPDTGVKEQSFYRSYQQQLATVQPFIYQEQKFYNSPKANNQSPREKNNYILSTIPEDQVYQLRNEDMLYQKQQIIQI